METVHSRENKDRRTNINVHSSLLTWARDDKLRISVHAQLTSVTQARHVSLLSLAAHHRSAFFSTGWLHAFLGAASARDNRTQEVFGRVSTSLEVTALEIANYGWGKTWSRLIYFFWMFWFPVPLIRDSPTARRRFE
jgi:hypothetical protein